MLESDLAGREHEDDVLTHVARVLRGSEDLGPAVDRSVMAALHAAPLAMVAGSAAGRRAGSGRIAGAWRWLAQPRSIRVSPIGALAAAGLAFVAAMLGVRRDADRPRVEEGTGEYPSVATGEYPAIRTASTPTASPPASRTRDTGLVTRFMIVAPNARQVTLVGDFNDWDEGSTPLLKVAANGVWTAEVRLPPGRYDYAFLVDGQQWVADPAAPPATGDDFGQPTSVLTVRGIDA